MKQYVGFTEEDALHLQQLLPVARPHLPRIAEDFYAAILRFPRAASIFTSPEQILRLKRTLQTWMEELLQGPHDNAYWRRRQRVGHVHVRVRLPQRYMFTAMNLIRTALCDIAQESFSVEEAGRIRRSVGRITDLDLAVMVETFREVHEQEELKTLQDLIIRNMPVTVICLDEKGEVTSATHPAPPLIRPGAAVGDHYTRFLSEEILEAADFPSHMGRSLASGREITVPRVVMGEGASARQFRLTLVPLEHDLARLLVHIEELTDVIQAQNRAQQSEHLARLGSLAANIAHEIRNPMAAISATLQVIVRSLGEDDRRRTVLDKVNEQVLRLNRLVTDLLSYSRPAEPKLERTGLGELATEAAAEAGVQVELKVHDHPQVLADPQYICQLLVNLLQNARDAAGPTGRIWVVVGPGPRVEVVDSGPGIPPELRTRIFEPFVTTKMRGTGLGLAISTKLAESMGASLRLGNADPDLVSAGAVGACFTLSLQTAPTPADLPSPGRGPASPAGSEEHSG